MSEDHELWFVEDEDGFVHLGNAHYMDEGMLCGLGSDNPVLSNWGTKATVVTCPRCIRIIKRLSHAQYQESNTVKATSAKLELERAEAENARLTAELAPIKAVHAIMQTARKAMEANHHE